MTNTYLGALQSFPGWSSAQGAFLGAHSLAVSLSLRSRQCCQTQMTRRITGSGHSSTWTPLTCAFPPWPPRLHRGRSMLTAWMSTSEGRVRTPCTSALSAHVKPSLSPCRGTAPQPSLSLAGAESLLQAVHHGVAVMCDLERDPVTFCFP